MKFLVAGAGMAGLSTAITLSAKDHDVTVVERAHHLRVNGSPIDIRGAAIDDGDVDSTFLQEPGRRQSDHACADHRR